MKIFKVVKNLMRKRLFIVIIFGMVLNCGQTPNIVFPEGRPLETPPIHKPHKKSPYMSPAKFVYEFFGEEEGFNTFLGKPRISRTRKVFENEEKVQELNKRFEKDCLSVDTATSSSFPCSKAVITLGVLGRANAEDSILKFLKKNKDLNPSARKAGFFALGYLVNSRIHQTLEHESGQTSIIPMKIIGCLPESLRPQGYKPENSTELCGLPLESQGRSEWNVKKQNDRDEIRWGLISLAQTGSKEAQGVLENLKGDSPDGTSRQAFVNELIKLHKTASEKNGLLCLYEPKNSECQ
ncbi:MAG: hypothetical protein WD425_13655 [Nitrospirales bacterium]